MAIILIAAIGENNELGVSNHLIWDLPKDRLFFKNKTNGHTVVMGRKTFESLPSNLPNRKLIVISSTDLSKKCDVVSYKSIDDLFNNPIMVNEDVFIIGGSSIYNEFLPYSDIMYLTEIKDTYKDADTFFPKINKSEWNIQKIDKVVENNVTYEHKKYTRKRVKNER